MEDGALYNESRLVTLVKALDSPTSTSAAIISFITVLADCFATRGLTTLWGVTFRAGESPRRRPRMSRKTLLYVLLLSQRPWTISSTLGPKKPDISSALIVLSSFWGIYC